MEAVRSRPLTISDVRECVLYSKENNSFRLSLYNPLSDAGKTLRDKQIQLTADFKNLEQSWAVTAVKICFLPLGIGITAVSFYLIAEVGGIILGQSDNAFLIKLPRETNSQLLFRTIIFRMIMMPFIVAGSLILATKDIHPFWGPILSLVFVASVVKSLYESVMQGFVDRLVLSSYDKRFKDLFIEEVALALEIKKGNPTDEETVKYLDKIIELYRSNQEFFKGCKVVQPLVL